MNTNHTILSSLFTRHYQELCLVAYYYVKDADEAEDIVQDVFARIIATGKDRKVENLKAYIFTAVRNQSLNSVQRKKISYSIDHNAFELSGSQSSKEEEMVSEEKKSLLHAIVRKLPEQCRQVFLLCAIEGLKYHEAADKLDISINTVKAQMKKAYRILRGSLSDEIFLFLLQMC
ncbi:RNA polymerase sigma-70 factor [Zhouia spongiae]|uniref:RNA polymerase sigma-70 factor n=1 Tax=Zhouia spongiae TaxID=2202721 RepID=A0ABY3YMA4_9FLAO|nr:RNA polymerase sigma-70 factor [Zhouia spongiae]UNY98758.1 RNA polymerase sigma-70 factor [Zhouia spongiae]